MPEDYSNQESESGQVDSISRHFIKLKLSQKIAFVVLAFFAIFVFGAWVVQLKNSIVLPLARPATLTTKDLNNTSTCTGLNCSQDEIEALKTKDTDKDGLNDYEELEIYKTSPYLEDTDSDGFSDYDEVQSDNNPNCPTGVDCNQIPFNTPTDNANNSVDIDSNIKPLEIGSSVSTDNNAVLENIFLGESDVKSLRALLIQSGMDENLLNQINDDDLMKYYTDTLKTMNEATEE